MTKLELLIGTNTYTLSDGRPFSWYAESNFGMGNITLFKESNVFQPGSNFGGFKVEEKTIPLVLGFRASTQTQYQQYRDTLNRIFAPRNTPSKLRYTLDDGTTRILEIYPTSMPLASSDRSGLFHKVAINLQAVNPLWRDESQLSYTYGVAAGNTGFIFPISFPIQFGISTIDQTRAIQYTGSYPSNPVVIIQGPITNPIITNLSTGQKLDFTGTIINANDYYVIDTRDGLTSVVDSTGTNQYSKLVQSTSDLNFRLDIDPVAPNGINSIQVTGINATNATEIYLRYYVQYIGI